MQKPYAPPTPPQQPKADPSDRPAQRTRRDTFAPRAVAPAPTPDTENNNRRITNFLTAAPRPQDPTMVTLSSGSTNGDRPRLQTPTPTFHNIKRPPVPQRPSKLVVTSSPPMSLPMPSLP